MKRLSIFFLTLLLSTSATAIDTGVAFEDPEMQARYENLIDDIRCLVCQNQTIKDSNVFLAADLRREVRRMMSEGMTDAEIADFLVARYGEFVLYSPPRSGRTLILWIAPGLFVLFGGFVLVRIVRERMTMPLDDDGLES
jgi:cytochrome c-type biogenesis protein CcmH